MRGFVVPWCVTRLDGTLHNMIISSCDRVEVKKEDVVFLYVSMYTGAKVKQVFRVRLTRNIFETFAYDFDDTS